LRREEEVEDTSDGEGQDSEEEDEGDEELELQQEEEEARHYEDEVVGVMDLPQDPHPHTDTGLATSFALL
jgi:hypothetical protein